MKKWNQKKLATMVGALLLVAMMAVMVVFPDGLSGINAKKIAGDLNQDQNFIETKTDLASGKVAPGSLKNAGQEATVPETETSIESIAMKDSTSLTGVDKDLKKPARVIPSRENTSTTGTTSGSTSGITSSTTSGSGTGTTTPTAPTSPTPTAPAPAPAPAPVEEPKANTVAGAFFVSKSGNDANPGTEAAPWKTIQKAANTLQAGQTVYVKAGTYNERVTLKNSGSSGNYITYTNYPGDSVIIDGTGIDWGYSWGTLLNVNSRHYIKINGFRVINSRWGGIGSQPDSNGSNQVVVTNCSTYNTQASGIAFYHASNITLDGNSVERACTAAGSQEGISLSNVATFTIKNNKVFNITNSTQGSGGEAIDAKNGSSNGKIYGNTVHDIAKIGIYIDAYSKTSANIEVYGNNIYNCGQGIAVATEKSGLLKNVNIYNNSIKNCSTGYAVGGWSSGYTHDMDTIKFTGNTLTGITSRGVYLNNPDAKNVFITNNKISGGSSMIPIHLNGGVLAQTFIDGNTFDRTIDLALAGTNYTFLN